MGKVTRAPTLPDEVGAKLETVQVVGLVQTGVHVVVEPHLLKLLPVSTWKDADGEELKKKRFGL